MASRGSAGDGIRESGIEKFPPETNKKRKSETEKNRRETKKKRISKIRGQLEQLQNKVPEEEKRMNKIRKQLEKLQEENPEEKRIYRLLLQLDNLQEKNANRFNQALRLVNDLEKKGSDKDYFRDFFDIGGCCGGSRVVYDRDSIRNRDPKTAQDLKKSARIAIGYFNQTNRIKYNVVDVIRATRSGCGHVTLWLKFTANRDGANEAETFETSIATGVSPTEVKSVKIVDA